MQSKDITGVGTETASCKVLPLPIKFYYTGCTCFIICCSLQTHWSPCLLLLMRNAQIRSDYCAKGLLTQDESEVISLFTVNTSIWTSNYFFSKLLWSDVTSPTGAEEFSFSLCVQTGPGTHPVSRTVCTGVPFLRAKAWPERDAINSPNSES
jgi:hypothetical protein